MGNDKSKRRKRISEIECIKVSALKEQNSNLSDIYKDIADKLIEGSNLYVLDFKDNNKKEVLINRVRYDDKILKFKQPIKILIKKDVQKFTISQNVFGVEVSNYPFSKALFDFQEMFYKEYLKSRNAQSGLKILYNSIVDIKKSTNIL